MPLLDALSGLLDSEVGVFNSNVPSLDQMMHYVRVRIPEQIRRRVPRPPSNCKSNLDKGGSKKDTKGGNNKKSKKNSSCKAPPKVTLDQIFDYAAYKNLGWQSYGFRR